MLKKLSLSVVVIALGVSTQISYAHVSPGAKACLSISNNNSPFDFVTTLNFRDDSSDGMVSVPLKNGQKCIEMYHRHRAGFKHYLNLGVKTSSLLGAWKTYIKIGSSCRFLYSTQPGAVLSGAIIIPDSKVPYWHFNLTQTPPTDEFKYNFKLECVREQ